MVNGFRAITTAIVDNVNLIEYKTASPFADILQHQFRAVYDAEIYIRLSDEWLERLSRYMTLATYQAGDVLFKEHGPSDFIGYIVEGRISFVRQRANEEAVNIDELGKGMMVGASIFDDYLRLSTAAAVVPTTLFMIKKDDLESLKRDEPDLALELFRDAARFMMQVLCIFGKMAVKYLDVLPA